MHVQGFITASLTSMPLDLAPNHSPPSPLEFELSYWEPGDLRTVCYGKKPLLILTNPECTQQRQTRKPGSKDKEARLKG